MSQGAGGHGQHGMRRRYEETGEEFKPPRLSDGCSQVCPVVGYSVKKCEEEKVKVAELVLSQEGTRELSQEVSSWCPGPCLTSGEGNHGHGDETCKAVCSSRPKAGSQDIMAVGPSFSVGASHQ